jgi:uncharacterized protein (TIGR04255 family)
MNWQPASEMHAIERVAFAALFSFPLGPKPFERELTKVRHEAAKSGINELIVLPQPVQIRFGAQDPKLSGPQLAPQFEFGNPGQAFRRTENGRVLEEIVFNPSALAFSATTYNRWGDFKARLKDCLSDALTSVAEDTYISELRIEYIDRFDLLSDDSSTMADCRGLINPNSVLISPKFKTQTGSWHEHIGFFLDDNGDVRTLVNANVDVIANSPGMPPALQDGYAAQAKFYTLTSAQQVGPNRGFEDWDNIEEHIHSRHELSKSIFGDLVHPTLAEKIRLEARPFGV